MQEPNVLLSISLLVSGRKETKQCLDSIRPILEQIPSELILVDTGCDPQTRTLIEEYTNKIYDFEWCKDFAKARNVGLNASTGLWFMFMDDDEWFEDPSEIVAFFMSKEYLKYNTATYVVRSYINPEGTTYSDANCARMIRKYEDTQFEGKIHEYLIPWRADTKRLSCYVHHYGYVYKNEQEKWKHSIRNIEPLEEIVQRTPGDIRWAAQLVQEYSNIEEFEKVIEVGEQAVRDYYEYGEMNYGHDVHLGSLFGFIYLACEALKQFEKEEEWINKGLSVKNISIPNKAFAYLAGVRMGYHAKDYGKSYSYFTKYLPLYEKYGKDAILIQQGADLIVEEVFADRMSFPVFEMGGIAALYTQHFAAAKKAFSMIDWNDPRMRKQQEVEQQVVNILSAMEYRQASVDILQMFVEKPFGMDEMYPVFLQQEIKYKQAGDLDGLNRLRIMVSHLEYDHRYILCTRILIANTREQIEHLFEQLFLLYGDEILDIKDEVWDVAEKNAIELEPYFLRIDYNHWKRQIEQWYREITDINQVKKWEERTRKWMKNSEDIHYDVFFLLCLELRLRLVRQCSFSIKEVEDLMAEYCERTLIYYHNLYQEYLFEKMPILLPLDVQFALHLSKLVEARRNGTDNDVLTVIATLKDFYTPMNDMLSYYTNLYQEEVHDRNDEMRQLAVQLKKYAKSYIIFSSLKKYK